MGAYSLTKNPSGVLVIKRRKDDSVVFKLAAKDRQFAETILFNLNERCSPA